MGTGAIGGHQTTQQEIVNQPSTSLSVHTEKHMMTCESCKTTFNILFKRKRTCHDCRRNFCSSCLIKSLPSNARQCQKCLLLSSGHFSRSQLMQFKIKDLTLYLTRKDIPTGRCTEKTDLVELVLKFHGNETYLAQEEEHARHVADLREKQIQEDIGMPSQRREEPASSSVAMSSSSSSSVPDTSQPRIPNSTTSDQQSDSPCPIPDDVPVASTSLPGSHYSNMDSGLSGARLSERLLKRREQEMRQSEAFRNEMMEQELVETRPGNVRAKLEDVESETDIESLTVKQLKEILVTNFVDYKGCVEKTELIDRVRRLWSHDQHNKKDMAKGNDTSEDTNICKICMDAAIDCVLLECGHMITCVKCGKQLSECPVCRQFVIRVVHVFKS